MPIKVEGGPGASGLSGRAISGGTFLRLPKCSLFCCRRICDWTERHWETGAQWFPGIHPANKEMTFILYIREALSICIKLVCYVD